MTMSLYQNAGQNHNTDIFVVDFVVVYGLQSCALVDWYRRSRGTYCLYLQP
jgi:hypothetical protein